MALVRLQKIIAESGMASRREAERMIVAGEITINGRLAKVGDKVIPGKDHIKVRGKLLLNKPDKVVVALYKPKGILSVRPLEQLLAGGTVFDLITKIKERVMPIGRLDTDTEGLLLLTNDGELSQRLLKAKFEVPKSFTVKIDGHLDEKKVKRLENGVRIEDEKIKPLSIVAIKRSEGKQWLQISTTDPRNRIIRKAMEAVGHPVDKIRRDSFAGISLRGMIRGQYRYLSPEELLKLRKWVGLE